MEVVVAAVRRLSGFISERKAREIAQAVLRELRRDGFCLMRAATPQSGARNSA